MIQSLIAYPFFIDYRINLWQKVPKVTLSRSVAHRAEYYCLSWHLLTVPSLSMSRISICMSRTYQLWLVNKFSFGNTWVALQISVAVNQTVWCMMSVPRCDIVINSTLIKGLPHCSQSVCRFMGNNIFYLTQ